jgi:hypothetical protein
MCHDSSGDAAVRYVADVVSLHRRLAYRGLAHRVPARDLLHRVERGDGLLTVAVSTRALPHRYLIGLQGFRLAQYLRLGWVCEDVVYSSALFHEPVRNICADDVHILTMNGQGAILGYLSLSAAGDGEPERLSDPGRSLFPVERVHAVNLFDHVAALPGVRTDQVREVKRFVHSRSLVDRQLRLRVTLELMYAMACVLATLRPAVRTLVGDLEENVALRHLLLSGLEVQIVEGTTPRLADRDLLHHAYVERASVKPFVAHLPDEEGIASRIRLLRQTLDSPSLFDAASLLAHATHGSLTRVAG